MAVLALTPQVVSAHALLLQTDPSPGAVLNAAPAAVTLIFSEPVTPAGAGIKIYAPSGAQVAGRVSARGAVLSAPLDTAAAGTYVVSWQVFAADTHPSLGAFAFSVGHISANQFAALLEGGSAGTSTPLGLALQALARWVHFAGFALAFGLVAYATAIRRGPNLRRFVTAGIVLLVVAEPLALLAQLASLSFDSDTALAVLGSNFGRLLGLRLGAAVLAWTVLATGRSWPLLAIGGVVAILDGAGAHAFPGVPVAGQLLVAAHVAAMGLWVGGLVGFADAPERRFGRYAAASLGAAVVTGLAIGLIQTGMAARLLSSDYGRVLVLKALLVVAALLAVAARRHRFELAVATAIIGAAALVAALPPPV